MKKYVAFIMAIMVIFSSVGCSSPANDAPDNSITNNSEVQEEEQLQIPVDFDIIPEENFSEIPEKSSLDLVVDEALEAVGVDGVKYKAYGNYETLADISATLEVFIITDTDKSLIVNMIIMTRSKEWDVMFVNDAVDNKCYYCPSDAGMTVDIYDYKTGELTSKKSMTSEELNEELKKKQEEADREWHKELYDIRKEYGLETPDTSDIAVRFEKNYIDGDRLHLTVFTKNNSDETFAGNVYVTFYSADGKDRLGSDTIIVDELLPGHESWADIIVDAYRGTPKIAVDFSEEFFTPVKEVTANIDSDVTEKTKSSYYWNFDGVSWYKDITDIVAYKNGTCVVVLKDNPKEGGQFYASTIWSCGNDHGVDTVQVVDAKGTIIAVYGNGEMVSVSVSNGKIVSESKTPTETQGTEPTESQTTSCSHSWNSGETTKKATCSETGIKTYTCLKCSEKKTETIPKTDHTYDAGKVSKNPTCTDVGKITYTCSACKAQYSEDLEKRSHAWDNGKVKNAATCTLEGTIEYHCTSCGITKTDSIPLVAHDYSQKIVSDKYLLSDATYTSGSVYYRTCVCGAIGNNTFTADDRIEWVSVSQLEYGGFNCSFALPLPDDDPQYYWLKNWDTEMVYEIYGVPSETLVNGKVYTCNCNGYNIRIKSEKTGSYSNYRDYFFFYYDDLVAAGII